jgi:site-specific DNA-methyltransferase (adenine-specific)
VWRIPPAFDGATRRALPRFTVLSAPERERIFDFFGAWATLLLPALRPGAHVVVAGNPLVSPLVAMAMERAGFERRAEIARLVRTFRGGDRPKGAEREFHALSTMPRACWEPWGLYRKPLSERTVAENLRRWGTGALRRISDATPFLDVIESATTPRRERDIAPHPSLKPQAFLRRIVAAVAPMPGALVLDPFAGSGSTLAACEALGIRGVGLESDEAYFAMARSAAAQLARLRTRPHAL